MFAHFDLTVYLTVRDSGDSTVSMALAHTFTWAWQVFEGAFIRVNTVACQCIFVFLSVVTRIVL